MLLPAPCCTTASANVGQRDSSRMFVITSGSPPTMQSKQGP